MTTTPMRHYSFTTTENIQEKIRTDLAPLGEVGDIHGDIVMVDGDWFLDDVSVTAAGRTIHCTKGRDDQVGYHFADGTVVNLKALRDDTVNPVDRSVPQILDSMFCHISQKNSSRFTASIPLIVNLVIVVCAGMFMVSGALALRALVQEDLGRAIPDFIIFLSSLSLMVAAFLLGLLVDRKRATAHEDVWSEHRDEMRRGIIRLDAADGVTYTGGLRLHRKDGTEYPSRVEDLTVRFKGYDHEGFRRTYETDGLTLWLTLEG